MSCFCQSASLWLLPLWVFSPVDHGGLNYGVTDFTLVLSTSGVLLWFLFAYLYDRIEVVVSSSPARAIRIGSGAMAFALFCIPVLARSTIHAAARGIAKTGQVSTATGSILEYWMKLLFAPYPSSTPTALILPAVLLSILVAGSYIWRRATHTILVTCISNSFAMPESVVAYVAGAADTLAPIVGAVLFSIFRDRPINLPLQSYVVQYLVVVIVGIMYSSTLVLNVHFRGDFGIVTELVIGGARTGRKSFMCCYVGNELSQQLPRHRTNNYESCCRRAINQISNCVADIYSVPQGDIQFLLTPAAVVAVHGGLVNKNVESPSSYKIV